MSKNQTAHVRFWSKVAQGENGCWVWMAYRDARGYGQYWRGDKKNVYAHRFAWEEIHGPLPPYTPKGLQLDHLCKNPSCVRPSHLELVAHQTNVLRGDGPTAENSRKTHCIHGHRLNKKNTFYSLSENRRRCKQCEEIREKAERRIEQRRIFAKKYYQENKDMWKKYRTSAQQT